MPRTLVLVGLIGAPMLVAGNLSVLFCLVGQREPSTLLFAIPVALFELSLGVLLVVKGFNSSAIITDKLKGQTEV